MVAPPSGPQVTKPDPENAVDLAEARAGIGPDEDPKLVAQDEVLEGEVILRAAQGEEGSEREQNQPKHPAGYHRRGGHLGPSRIQIPICRPSPTSSRTTA